MTTPTATPSNSENSAGLKSQLEIDLRTAMKSRDKLTTATLRMALAAIRTEEIAGKTPRVLTDDQVRTVLAREEKKRQEAAEAFSNAGRVELADQERAEGQVIARYLPTQLTDAELADLVHTIISETGADSPKQFGAVMKTATARVGGQAAGGRIAAEVKRQLAG